MVSENAGRVTGTDTYLKGRLQGVVRQGVSGQQVTGTFVRTDGTRGKFAWVTDGERFHGAWEANGVRKAWSGVRQGGAVQPGLHAFLGRRGTPLDGFPGDLVEGVERETKKAVKEAVGKVTKDVKKRVNKEVDKAKKRAEEEWEKVQKSIPGLPDSDAGGDKVKADLEKRIDSVTEDVREQRQVQREQDLQHAGAIKEVLELLPQAYVQKEDFVRTMAATGKQLDQVLHGIGQLHRDLSNHVVKEAAGKEGV